MRIFWCREKARFGTGGWTENDGDGRGFPKDGILGLLCTSALVSALETGYFGELLIFLKEFAAFSVRLSFWTLILVGSSERLLPAFSYGLLC